MLSNALQASIAAAVSNIEGLRLLILFGSRARGDARAASDWDFAQAGVTDAGLASRLARAAGFRNVVAHAYDQLDMARVYRAGRDGPADLRAFLGALRDRLV